MGNNNRQLSVESHAMDMDETQNGNKKNLIILNLCLKYPFGPVNGGEYAAEFNANPTKPHITIETVNASFGIALAP